MYFLCCHMPPDNHIPIPGITSDLHCIHANAEEMPGDIELGHTHARNVEKHAKRPNTCHVPLCLLQLVASTLFMTVVMTALAILRPNMATPKHFAVLESRR